jgi:hypothetical protein
MHQSVDLAESGLELREELINLRVVGDIAAEAFCAGKIGDQVLGFLFQSFILISNDELRASGVEFLRDRPGNASLVGHSKDNGGASLHVDHRWKRIAEGEKQFLVSSFSFLVKNLFTTEARRHGEKRKAVSGFYFEQVVVFTIEALRFAGGRSEKLN